MVIQGQEKPSLEDLAHFGVMGMKWGVRRGGLGSRLKGTLADKRQREVAVATRFRENRAVGLREHLGRGLTRAVHPTKKGFNKTLDKVISKRSAQIKRLETGKLKVRDVLQIAGHLTLPALVISVRDDRG